MFLNKIIPVMMGGLLLCLIVVNCERDLSTESEIQDEEPEVVKDGVITLRFYIRTPADSNLMDIGRFVDSLNVSETEHCVYIDNAILFSVPELSGTSFWWGGRFNGIPDPQRIFLWCQAYEGEQVKKVKTFFMDDFTGHISLTPIGQPSIGRADGYIMVLDTDDDNSGDGLLEISKDTLTTDITVSAKANTAVLPENLPKITIQLPDTMTQFHMTCESSESFVNCKDGAVICIEFNRLWDGEQSIHAQSSFNGRGYTALEGTTQEFTIWAFVPVFLQKGD
jgi:hypothetical protein